MNLKYPKGVTSCASIQPKRHLGGVAEVNRIMNLDNVDRAVGHKCQYGAEHDGQPIKKPTGFMSNSSEVRKAVSKVCNGKHGHCSRLEGGYHVLCNGRFARMAAIFPVNLCKAILRGLSRPVRKDGLITDGVVGMNEFEHGRNHEAEVDDGSIMSV